MGYFIIEFILFKFGILPAKLIFTNHDELTTNCKTVQIKFITFIPNTNDTSFMCTKKYIDSSRQSSY